MSKFHKFIAGVFAVIVIAGGTFYLLSRRIDIDEVNSNADMQTLDRQQNEKLIELVKLELPGAQSITAINENYSLDSSLWRVVSRAFPLDDENYRPENLQRANVPSRSDKSEDERSVRADIIPDLDRMLSDAKALGSDLMIGSGFRSYDLQNVYYSNYVRLYSQAEADKFSAKPGQSEHQTGLVVDLAYTDMDCYLAGCFADTPAGVWLTQNAHKYGFILRYPEGKESITGFQFEPWHFRYVGKDLARAIKESGLTLDEAKPYLDKALTELKARGQ